MTGYDHCMCQATEQVNACNCSYCANWFIGDYCHWCSIQMRIEFEWLHNNPINHPLNDARTA